MIFDTVSTASTNWNAVQESAYPLGLEGGLMHVYENECNFNAIMKSAGIAELKYYKECGGDLFLQEAGATSGLLDKFIAFFKSVITKIQQMFKKFMMKISSYVSSDKKFVDKYKKEVFKNFKTFKFTGWNFDIDEMSTPLEKVAPNSAESIAKTHSDNIMSDDEIEKRLNKFRSELAGTDVDGDEEFKKEYKKSLYGDEKEEIEISASYCAKCFDIISNTEKNIKVAKKSQDNATKTINDLIKNLERAKELVAKSMPGDNNVDTDHKNNQIASITKHVELEKGRSNILTTSFSMLIGALKDRNRQCKAICVKALNSGSRKSTEESAMYGEFGDIFAGVEII